jgi:enoyl-CoA hydratase
MSEAAGLDIVFAEQGNLGRITLNRPKAINALTHGMIDAIDRALQRWENDSAIRIILLEGASERGFCAGGDIRALYDDAKDGRYSDADLFFRDEYRLNARIAEYPKPIVAFMDGIVMGGGIGLSAHASHRVVTPAAYWPCRKSGSGSFPMLAALFCWRAHPAAWVSMLH